MSLTEYDDFFSLRLRLTTSTRGSDKGPITTYKNITQEGTINHTDSDPYTLDDANRLNTDNTPKHTGYDDFTSLRLRLTAVQTRSSVGSFDNPITTAEAGAPDDRVTPAAEEIDNFGL